MFNAVGSQGVGFLGLEPRIRLFVSNLPNVVYWILVNEWIGGDYSKPVDNGMANQKSVEGIAMVHGKASEEVDICIRKCMVEHFMLGNRLGNKLMRRNAKKEISFVIFDLNFKRACLMKNNFVVRICQ